ATRFNTGTNLGYQQGRVTLFGTYGFNADGRGIVGINGRQRFAPGGSTLDFQNQDLDETYQSAGHNFSGNIDYKLTGHDVISNSMTVNRRHANDAVLAGYVNLDANQAFLDRYVMDVNTRSRGLVWDDALSWKHTIQPR